jgi:predicted acyl esterase
VQGWTDVLFPAVQSLRMYRKLMAASPSYPISMVLGDLGHGAKNPASQSAFWHDEAFRFVTTALSGEKPDRLVASFPASCTAEGASPVTAGKWEPSLTKKPLRLSATTPARTDSFSSDLGQEAAGDPALNDYFYRLDKEVLGGSLDRYHGACVESSAGASSSGASWRWSLPSGTVLLGLPTVRVGYALTGEDATVTARLWDVGSDGTKTLVTRGVYRISTAAGDMSEGEISFELFGNHWSFRPGHQLELELGQRDAPFFRPNNLPSALEIDHVALEMPLGER